VRTYPHELSAPVDLLIPTGDLIEGGAVQEYRAIAEAVAGNIPAFFCPGNRDQREHFHATLSADRVAEHLPAGAPVNSAWTFGGFTVIMLDSSVPGQYHGALDPATIGWLNATPAELPRDTPVLIGMHHPPVELGHPGVDRVRLPDAEPLAATLRRYPDIVAVLVGRTHAATATTFVGRPPMDEAASPGLAIPLPHDDISDGARITNYYRTVVS